MSPHVHNHDDEPIERIRIGFFLNLSFTVIELVGGYLTSSVAITADAIHDLGDSISLGLALILEKKSRGKPNSTWTYGYRRFSTLSAFICSLVLLVGSAIILYESIPRLWHPTTPPHSEGMMGLAILGIVVNGFAVLRLSKGHSQNEKVLSLHLLEDVLGWVAVLLGSIVIFFTGWAIVDTLLAISISVFVLINVFKNLRSILSVFLQSIPEKINVEELIEEVRGFCGVKNVNSYHAWSLDGIEHVFTCQVLKKYGNSSTLIKNSIRKLLEGKGFTHITIEIVENSDNDICHSD